MFEGIAYNVCIIDAMGPLNFYSVLRLSQQESQGSSGFNRQKQHLPGGLLMSHAA